MRFDVTLIIIGAAHEVQQVQLLVLLLLLLSFTVIQRHTESSKAADSGIPLIIALAESEGEEIGAVRARYKV